MKHGQEKSDLFIVAMKPANKPGRLGAELVEPMGEDRGEHGRATHAPDSAPVSVSQRLDRVRGAACELLR
jgi:RNA-directed DNA polymerase